MAKDKIVRQTQGATLPPAQEAKPNDKVEIVQGNTSILTIQLLAQVNRNLVEVVKRLDELIGIAKNG